MSETSRERGKKEGQHDDRMMMVMKMVVMVAMMFEAITMVKGGHDEVLYAIGFLVRVWRKRVVGLKGPKSRPWVWNPLKKTCVHV
jgi:hypothetical protein